MSSLPRTRIPARVAVALTVLAAALVVVLLVRNGSSSSAERSPQTDPISADASFSPRVAAFGDTLTARIDVVVDRTTIDADSVEVSWSPEPWKEVQAVAQSRRDSGGTTHLSSTYVLRCLRVICVPARDTEVVEFEDARVTYQGTTGGDASRLSLSVPWPTLPLHSRFGGSDSGQQDALAAPWRADFLSLPAVSYRVNPGVLLALLVAGGLLFLATAAAIAFRALPERVPPPEPEPEPEPVIPPLEQALAVLEAEAATNGAEDRRRALELVAEEVERLGDDDELVRDARTLAWSEDDPDGDEGRALAARLRSRLERTNGVPA